MTKSIDEVKYCPIIKPTKIIGDVWNLLIIKSLLESSKRFNEIREAIPEVTSRTLSGRLKNLTELGLIKRKQFPEIPPRVEYSITEMGKSLQTIIKEVEDFGNRWLC